MTTITKTTGALPTVTLSKSTGTLPTVTIARNNDLTATVAKMVYGSLISSSGEDTSMRNDNADANYHTSTSNYVGELNSGVYIFRTLIKFDLSKIPSGALIISATLQMTMNANYSSATTDMTLHRVLRNWVINQATWNSYSTGNTWQTAGGFGALDAEQAAVATREFTAAEANGVKSWTIDTDSVKEWIDGDTSNYGWLIKTSVESDDGYRFATDNDAVEANRPKLTIVYITEEGTAYRTDYWTVGTMSAAIVGNPTDRHNFHPVHDSNILEMNMTIDGAIRKYLAYDSHPGGTEIRLYYTNSLDSTWTQYSANPILTSALPEYRWPSVVYDGSTLHMFLSDRTNAQVERWTSSDGITFTFQEAVVTTAEADDQYFNPFIFYSTHASKWMLYYKIHASGVLTLYLKSSATIAGLTAASPEMVSGGVAGGDLQNTAAPSMLYINGLYWMLTEGYPDPGYWVTYARRSKEPNTNLVDSTAILGDTNTGHACAIHLLSPDGNSIYLYTSAEISSEWYAQYAKISV